MNESENQKSANMDTDNTKRYLFYAGIAVLVVLGIVVLFGRMEFHTELERKIIPHAFAGYLDDTQYSGTVTVCADEWPEWAGTYDRPEEDTVQFEDDALSGYIGIFADVVYYENRYENRSWFSGRLIERASEYYYKPEGPLYLEVVYESGREPDIPLEEMVPQQYDYMAFDGGA